MARSSFKLAARRKLHPIYRHLETVVHPLRYLFLEVTQKCNLDCLHCGSDCGKQPRVDELTTGEWLAFIDYLDERRPKGHSLFLVFTGGEPLCHQDLLKLCARARLRGLPYGMVTNGFLLDDHAVSRLVEEEITSLTVSLDGLEATHDWLRGRLGSFNRAVSGIALAARSPIRFMDVVTCVNPRNLAELSRILELLQSKGVTRWRLFNIFPKGRAKGNGGLSLSPEQIAEMLDWIRRTRRRLDGTGFHLDFSCEGFLPPDLDAQVRDEPYFCRAGICIGSVLCDGAISACPNIARDLVQGTIRRDDFFDVWEHRFEPYRDRRWMKQGDCVTCKQWRRCRGNSLHLWDAERQETALCYHTILT
jgi:radical SAM enzyme (rSAM/lipoprotein system)